MADEVDDQHGILDTSTISSSGSIEQFQEYKVYTRRWYILSVVCILNIANAVLWISFSPIADLTGQYYNVSSMSVNWLSLVFLVASIPCGVIASGLLDTLGLRAGIILGAWITLVGAILRIFSSAHFVPQSWRFPLIITGQSVAACAQPFVMFSPTKLAALWFKDDQRALANMVASMSNPLGILVANVIAPKIVTSINDFFLLQMVCAAPAVVSTAMATFGVCSSLPPKPPTPSAAQTSEPFVEGLKQIVKNKAYWVLFMCFGAGLGLFTSLTTLLEQILCPRGYDDDFAGTCGALLIACGITGALCAGIYVDKTKQFMEVAKCSYALAAIAGAFFTIIARYEGQKYLVGLSVCLFGFFGFALYPICLELAVETTYPVAEGTSAGFLIISGQLQGIVFIILMQVLAQPLSQSQLPDQVCSKSTSDSVLEYTYPGYFFLVVACLAAICLMIFFKTEYRRLKAEQQIAAERILNFSSRDRTPLT